MDRIEHLSLRDLRLLVTLAERQHFARTADEFDLSQSTLSAAVKKIEAAFGTPLLERSSRRVSLTPEGEAVVRQAHAVLEEARRLAHVLDPAAAPLTGRFRLGAFPTLGPYLFPLALGPLRDAYPGLDLTLTEALTDELLRQLRGRLIDGALLALPQDSGDLTAFPLFREPFWLAVSTSHPLARRAALEVDEVPLEELLLLEPGHCLRDQVLAACGTGFLAHRRTVHAAGLETQKAMVAAGMGCAVLPALAVPGTHPGIALLPFASPVPGREIALVVRRGGADPRDAREMATLLRQVARRHPALAPIEREGG